MACGGEVTSRTRVCVTRNRGVKVKEGCLEVLMRRMKMVMMMIMMMTCGREVTTHTRVQCCSRDLSETSVLA